MNESAKSLECLYLPHEVAFFWRGLLLTSSNSFQREVIVCDDLSDIRHMYRDFLGDNSQI